jgi:hypothetical protein
MTHAQYSTLAPDAGVRVHTMLLYMFKVMRLMVLWIALYTLDKVWQDAYIQHLVANEEGCHERVEPPSLLPIIVLALGMEAIVMMVLVLILWLVRARYGSGLFLIDQRLLHMLGVDYLFTTGMMLALGVLVSSVVQDTRLFRYRDDGMRSIRANCTLLLSFAALVLLLPMYSVG